MRKKTSKERLFEVMGRVAPNFTGTALNETHSYRAMEANMAEEVVGEEPSNAQTALDMQNQSVVNGSVNGDLINKFMEFFNTLSNEEKEEFKNIRWEEIMKNTPKQEPEMGAELADYER